MVTPEQQFQCNTPNNSLNAIQLQKRKMEFFFPKVKDILVSRLPKSFSFFFPSYNNSNNILKKINHSESKRKFKRTPTLTVLYVEKDLGTSSFPKSFFPVINCYFEKELNTQNNDSHCAIVVKDLGRL
ncbi:hypothetical protein CEXT_416761 [Caerostris extrusa]|uniref:Uncharacterized protein n=1 Tax=Caerostris extrusa TaxID=172846 RepID=A0AAV4V6Z1_CAEEX|nr:hypothetical protein CEXT_416761 [Caerostris extrusa]